MKQHFTPLIASALFLGLSQAASAQVLVMGKGKAHDCYRVTANGNSGTNDAIKLCEDALDNYMRKRDRAATHVNRGVLLMRAGQYEKSVKDYKIAIDMRPELDQAYINNGAALFHLGEYGSALSSLNTAIDMDTEKMPEALYNRSLVYHAQNDYKSAYYDLKAALKLRPDWEPALAAIDRYDVKKGKAGA